MKTTAALLLAILCIGAISVPGLLARNPDSAPPPASATRPNEIEATQIPPSEWEATFELSFMGKGDKTATPPKLHPIVVKSALYTGALPRSLLSQRPKARIRVPPYYPFEFSRSPVKGSVVIAFVVRPNGDVANLKVLSATDRLFAIAAASALQHWKYSAGLLDGKPTKTLLVQRFDFNFDRPLPDKP